MDSAVNAMLRFRSSPDHCLIRVAAIEGFAVRHGSDGAVLGPDGLTGTLLGGLIDDVLERAPCGGSRRAVTVSVSDGEADAAGQVCGGQVTVLLSPLSDLPVPVFDLLSRAEPLVLVTHQDPASSGELAVTATEQFGTLGAIDPPAVESARALLSQGSSSTTTVEVDGNPLIATVLVPQTTMHLVGSGPMADAISAQCQLMGWEATKSDDLKVALDHLRRAGPADGIVVLSHDRSVDVPALAAALDAPVGYIGAMGSRRTQAARAAILSKTHPVDILTRINGPVGLDLGARNPAEVAVAVVAEFLAHRAGRSAISLTKTDIAIH